MARQATDKADDDHLVQQFRAFFDEVSKAQARAIDMRETDPAMAALSGRIEVRFADTALITQAIDGTPCELEFNYSLGANANFTFTAHAVYLPRPRIEIAGPQGVQATFDWMAAKATSPARMCTAVLVNTLAGY